MAPAPRPAFVFTLAWLVGRAGAEVYKVTKEDVPPFTLATKHLFYVDASTASGQDHDRGSGSAPGEDEAQAQVLFEDFRVTSSAPGLDQDEPWSLQVGLIPWEDFYQLVDKAHFCDANGEVALRDRLQKKYVTILKVPFGKTVTQQMQIARTGAYVAFLSNCGARDDLHVSGAISVKGSSSFLPASRQSALALFRWCLALYIIAGVAWVASLASNRKDLHEPHYAIASFIAFGVGEAACYWHFWGKMDDTGESWVWLEKLCQGMSIMKTTYMFAVIMLLCFGVGLTQAEEYSNISWKLQGVTTLFSAALAPKVFVFDHRHAKSLSHTGVVLSMVPAVLVTSGSVAWGLTGISKTEARCRDLNCADSLRLLRRLVVLIMVLLTAAGGVLAAQALDEPGGGAIWWQHHLFWSDVAGEALHLMALVSLMILCHPSQATFKAGAYTASEGEVEMEGVPCALEESELDGILDLGETRDEESGLEADAVGARTP